MMTTVLSQSHALVICDFWL